MGDPKLAAQEPTSDVAHWPRDIKETESAVHRPWARISTASGGRRLGAETNGTRNRRSQVHEETEPSCSKASGDPDPENRAQREAASWTCRVLPWPLRSLPCDRLTKPSSKVCPTVASDEGLLGGDGNPKDARAGLSFGGWPASLLVLHCPEQVSHAVWMAPGGTIGALSMGFWLRLLPASLLFTS